MTIGDFLKWAGFTGIGGGVAASTQGDEPIPIWGDMSSAAPKLTGFKLSFTSKLIIGTGLTVIGLYAVRRLLK